MPVIEQPHTLTETFLGSGKGGLMHGNNGGCRWELAHCDGSHQFFGDWNLEEHQMSANHDNPGHLFEVKQTQIERILYSIVVLNGCDCLSDKLGMGTVLFGHVMLVFLHKVVDEVRVMISKQQNVNAKEFTAGLHTLDDVRHVDGGTGFIPSLLEECSWTTMTLVGALRWSGNKLTSTMWIANSKLMTAFIQGVDGHGLKNHYIENALDIGIHHNVVDMDSLRGHQSHTEA
ncbi:hypothetical protein EDD15DRAFT_2200780 [Pisolithus albus]|nr:hypothetical protein EDD15DRAFT_2200780 [Pisolithus albus]